MSLAPFPFEHVLADMPGPRARRAARRSALLGLHAGEVGLVAGPAAGDAAGAALGELGPVLVEGGAGALDGVADRLEGRVGGGADLLLKLFELGLQLLPAVARLL